MLWVLIRSASERLSTHDICFHTEIKKMIWDTPSYPLCYMILICVLQSGCKRGETDVTIHLWWRP